MSVCTHPGDQVIKFPYGLARCKVCDATCDINGRWRPPRRTPSFADPKPCKHPRTMPLLGGARCMICASLRSRDADDRPGPWRPPGDLTIADLAIDADMIDDEQLVDEI